MQNKSALGIWTFWYNIKTCKEGEQCSRKSLTSVVSELVWRMLVKLLTFLERSKNWKCKICVLNGKEAERLNMYCQSIILLLLKQWICLIPRGDWRWSDPGWEIIETSCWWSRHRLSWPLQIAALHHIDLFMSYNFLVLSAEHPLSFVNYTYCIVWPSSFKYRTVWKKKTSFNN